MMRKQHKSASIQRLNQDQNINYFSAQQFNDSQQPASQEFNFGQSSDAQFYQTADGGDYDM